MCSSDLVTAPLDPDQPIQECYPAWVANRQRDCGDLAATLVEGWVNWRKTAGINSHSDRGVSRREQRKLPFRVNPECAEERIILAAPGYGCMFQIPLMIPNDPNSSGYGVQVSCNSLLDKPRALGVPKARMVEPNVALGSPAFMISTTAASPEFGFAAGTYQISISYEDETTGEEIGRAHV